MTSNTDTSHNNQVQQNRQLRLFISSTFADMNVERDALTRIFPQINELCNRRGVEFIPLDLRWGITEEDSREGRVIDACLSEIDEARPFFIGIIGNRYGWTPSVEDIGKSYNSLSEKYPWINDAINNHMSITEMEMQYAVLMLNEENSMNAAFYIRSENMEVDSSFKEKKGSEGEDKLKKLKEKISSQDKFKVSRYDSAEDLAERALLDVEEFIDRTFPKVKLSSFEIEKINQENILAVRSRSLMPLTRYDDVIKEWMAGKNKRNLLITGKRGRGKSYLLASIISILKKERKKVVYADFSEFDKIDDACDFILRECLEILGVRSHEKSVSKRLYNNKLKFLLVLPWSIIRLTFSLIITVFRLAFGNQKKAIEKHRNVWNSVIKSTRSDYLTINYIKDNYNDMVKALAKRPDIELYLALDNLDGLTDEEIYILDLFGMTKQVRTIYTSCKDSKAQIYLQNLDNVHSMKMENLNAAQAREYVRNYLSRYGKSLDSKGVQCNRLLKSGIAGVVQLLTYTLNLMVRFGSYEEIDSYITELSAVKNERELYEILIKNMMNQFTKEDDIYIFKRLLITLISVDKGLSESEILDIIKPKPIQWSLMRPYIYSICKKRGKLIRIGSTICKMVIRQMFKNELSEVDDKIAEYFENMLSGAIVHEDLLGKDEIDKCLDKYSDDARILSRQVSVLPELYYRTGNLKHLYNWITYIHADSRLSKSQRMTYWYILYKKGYRMSNIEDIDIPPYVKNFGKYARNERVEAVYGGKTQWVKSDKKNRDELYNRWSTVASFYNIPEDMSWIASKAKDSSSISKEDKKHMMIVNKYQTLFIDKKYDEIISESKNDQLSGSLKVIIDMFVIYAYENKGDISTALAISRNDINEIINNGRTSEKTLTHNIIQYAVLASKAGSEEDCNLALELLEIQKKIILTQGYESVEAMNLLHALSLIHLRKKDYENSMKWAESLHKSLSRLNQSTKLADDIIEQAKKLNK